MQQSISGSEQLLCLLNTLSTSKRSGELLLQHRSQSAKVYLNNGLVVWAFATGQGESFQSILIHERQMSKEQLLQGIKEAREQGRKNLDEILAALGIADAAIRAEITLRHTRAALKVLSSWEECVVQFTPYTVEQQNANGLPLPALIDEPLPSARPELLTAASKPKRVQKQTVIQPHPVSDKPPTDINDLLQRFQLEVPGFVAVMVIDGNTGMPIASISEESEIDLEAVSAYFQNLITTAKKAMMTLRPAANGYYPLDEILISGTGEFVLLKLLREGEHMLYLLVDKTTNPGMARVVIRRYSVHLEGFLS